MPSVEQILEQERLEQAQENGVEVAIFELVDRQASTWIRQGTENLPEPQRKDAPAARQILNRSAYATNVKRNAKDEIIKYDRVETRHILGCDNIETKKQAGDSTALPNADNDRIVFIDGRLIVANEGAKKSLFKFMRKDSRNETFKERIPGVDAVYREIFPEFEKEGFNEEEFLRSEAIESYIRPMIEKTSSGFKYKEDKLNAYCRLFGVSAETNGGKVESLMQLAKAFPKDFIEKAKIFEESIVQEIAAAISLGLIKFEAVRVTYLHKDEVIITYSAQLSQQQKVQKLADFFRSEAGIEKYNTFVAELEFKKKQTVENN